MKFSNYNYFVPYKESIILFNGLSRQFMILPKEVASEVELFFQESDKIEQLPDSVRHKFISSSFIIEDNFDEFEYIKKKIDIGKKEGFYSLMIFPTYNCNFSCWYCVQKHEDRNLSEDIVERIKKHIEYYLKNNNINIFEITWFGGEPLLKFEDIIVDISLFAINLCDELGIRFVNTITTNGFLMGKTIVDRMKEMQFKSFQITIDGERDMHNITRHDPLVSSFDTIVSNIVYLLESMPDIHFTLRYNYTPENLNINLIISQLNEIIPFALRGRIDFLPRKVWQIEEKEIDNTSILNMIKTIDENGYNIIDVDIKERFIPCYVERKHFNTIFHSGAVDKCGNIDPTNAKGYLNSNGEIIWNSENDFSLNNKCIICKYLPMCMGGCPRDKDYFNKNNCFKCHHTQKSHYDIITNYCETILLKQK